jgi:uncharacterized protein YdiU (UPF0061 family)
MEAYDPQAVFSSIDRQGRYAYGNQPAIARWNLARLAESLLPLLADDPEQAIGPATEVIDAFVGWYADALLAGQRAKLGLRHATAADDEQDTVLVADWLALLHAAEADFTLAWRHLAAAAAGMDAPLRALFAEPSALSAWLARWSARCAADDAAGGDANEPAQARAARMRAVNPWIIPRNHRVEEALAAASDRGDLAPFDALLAALLRPFSDDAGQAAYAEPAPAAVTARYQTFCGT